MSSTKPFMITVLLVLAFTIPKSSCLSADEKEPKQIRISGQCVKCLIEIRNEMKRDHQSAVLDQLVFKIDENSKEFDITVGPASPFHKGGCITYKCSKSSGAILQHEYGK